MARSGEGGPSSRQRSLRELRGDQLGTSAWTQTGTSEKDRDANTPEIIEEINETEPGSRDREIIRVTENRGRPERGNQ